MSKGAKTPPENGWLSDASPYLKFSPLSSRSKSNQGGQTYMAHTRKAYTQSYSRFQASTTKYMKTALFWAITQREVVISHRRFGTTCRSHLQGPRRWGRYAVPKRRWQITATHCIMTQKSVVLKVVVESDCLRAQAKIILKEVLGTDTEAVNMWNGWSWHSKGTNDRFLGFTDVKIHCSAQ